MSLYLLHFGLSAIAVEVDDQQPGLFGILSTNGDRRTRSYHGSALSAHPSSFLESPNIAGLSICQGYVFAPGALVSRIKTRNEPNLSPLRMSFSPIEWFSSPVTH